MTSLMHQALGLVALVGVATAHAQLACVADFAVMGQGQQAIAITFKTDGRFDAHVNGTLTHANGAVADEPVRPQLSLKVDPNGPEFAGLNGAERSLVHLNGVLELPQSRDLVKIPFALAQVRRIKTYDLAGRSDKFGGHVLLEAYDERGAVLGRVVRRIFVAACR